MPGLDQVRLGMMAVMLVDDEEQPAFMSWVFRRDMDMLFLLDALDDVYDHIVVVSHIEPAKDLFEAMQGRFDCGIVLVDEKAQKAKAVGEPGMFLGYEVDGIALFAFEKKPEASRARQKFASAG